ncbi:MAG: hypothetical protein FJX74_10315 [Armatimonadetes bacterium]|nr:hypothetical protein [Armatimonadota bacterium]
MTLLPLKTTYEPDETIQFLLLVTNVTSRGQERPICLDARMVYNAHVRLEVADADGQDVRRPPGVVVFAEPAPPLQRDFVYLQPDRFLGREVLASRDPALTTALQPSGVYDVSATFESWEEGGQWELHAWTGSMTSNHVRVTITKGEARP